MPCQMLLLYTMTVRFICNSACARHCSVRNEGKVKQADSVTVFEALS